ncbi:MAG: hypothetical protein HYU64_19370 [Armatimonadetes bacterium]|nr:hypothetical protein [Armatimonadota bacterium]
MAAILGNYRHLTALYFGYLPSKLLFPPGGRWNERSLVGRRNVSEDVYFLDVNIPMYAAWARHPYKAPCVQVMQEIAAGRIIAAIDDEHFDRIAGLTRVDPNAFLRRE